MTILYISTMPSCYWGGSEELWALSAEQAIKKGFHVYIFVVWKEYEHPRLLSLKEKGAQIIYRKLQQKTGLVRKIINKIIRTRAGFGNDSQDYYELYLKVSKICPNVICINQCGTFSIVDYLDLVWLIGKYNSRYILISQQNAEHFVYNQIMIERIRCVLKNISHFIFVSQRNLRVAERQIASNISNISTIIPNPFCKRDLVKIPFPQSDDFIFAFLGRVDCRTKGLDLLLESLSSSKWQSRNWMLNIYGQGDDLIYLNELSQFYSISDKVIFNGFCTNMPEVWKSNKFLIMPSIAEGLPLAIIESMMFSRAVVTTDVGDSSTLVIDGETGFLAKAATVDLIDEAMEKAWNNKHLLQSLGENANAKIKKLVTGNESLKLLDKLIEYSE